LLSVVVEEIPDSLLNDTMTLYTDPEEGWLVDKFKDFLPDNIINHYKKNCILQR